MVHSAFEEFDFDDVERQKVTTCKVVKPSHM